MKNGILQRAFYSIAIVAACTAIVLQAIPVKAANENFSTVANKTVTIGNSVEITDLQITGEEDDELTLALSAPNGTFAFGTEAATVTGSGSNVVLSGSRSQINTTLSTLTYTPSSIGTATITADLNSTIAGVYVDPDNGHGYIMVRASDDCEDDCYFTWYQAKDAAEGYTYGGVSGYLATITSQEENDFIYSKLQENGWIGANDLAVEGEWRWVTGPEAGQQFWQGDQHGASTGEMYANWVPEQEPNGNTSENCALFWDGTGGWNDLDCNEESTSYVVEFGEDSNVPQVMQKQFTVTANPVVQNISSCEQLLALNENNLYDTINLTADIDCQGYEVEPLMDGNTFYGILQGNNHTIRNVTMNTGGSAGLFSWAVGATFADVTLDHFTLEGNSVGALAIYAEGVTVTNVHITNVEIDSQWGYTGGMFGEMGVGYGLQSHTHIDKSSVAGGTITSSYGASFVGGLIGYSTIYDGATALIEQTYTDVTVQGNSLQSVGGLIGQVYVDPSSSALNTRAILQDVYTWGDVTVSSGSYIGSIVGYAYVANQSSNEDPYGQFIVRRAYSAGNVSAENYVGGLVGYLGSGTNPSYTLQNVFAMGHIISSSNNAGALIGGADEGVTMSSGLVVSGLYYDATRTQQSTAGPVAELDDTAVAVNIGGSQPNYFINNSANAPLDTWNFSGIWVDNSDVPPTFKPVVSQGSDSDNDTISDAVENAGPNDGDANGDNIKDRLQSNVASFANPLTGDYTVVALDNNCSITSVSVAAEDSTVRDTAYNYNSGLVHFTADCSGEQTLAKIYQYGVSANNMTVRKYDSTNHSYFTINSSNGGNGYSLTTQTIGGQTVAVASYTIVDNGDLDLDKTSGHITDPVGLGISADTSSNPGTPNTSFIQRQSIVLFGAGALLILALGTTALFLLKKLHLSRK